LYKRGITEHGQIEEKVWRRRVGREASLPWLVNQPSLFWQKVFSREFSRSFLTEGFLVGITKMSFLSVFILGKKNFKFFIVICFFVVS
jgi:hypothetical protein